MRSTVFLLPFLIFGTGFGIVAKADVAPPPPVPAEVNLNLEGKPDGVTSAWPYVRWFYASMEESDQGDNDAMYRFIPDRYKLDFISPLLVICGGIGIFITAVWFLVKEFQVHWGWGVGQLMANVGNCILIVPGFIVALIFLIMHWHKAFNVFILGVIFWAILILGILMIPSWAPELAKMQTSLR